MEKSVHQSEMEWLFKTVQPLQASGPMQSCWISSHRFGIKERLHKTTHNQPPKDKKSTLESACDWPVPERHPSRARLRET
eukprot:287468-Amphidinium_carterae.1